MVGEVGRHQAELVALEDQHVLGEAADRRVGGAVVGAERHGDGLVVVVGHVGQEADVDRVRRHLLLADPDGVADRPAQERARQHDHDRPDQPRPRRSLVELGPAGVRGFVRRAGITRRGSSRHRRRGRRRRRRCDRGHRTTEPVATATERAPSRPPVRGCSGLTGSIVSLYECVETMFPSGRRQVLVHLQVDTSSPVPPYEQIRAQLQAMVTSGALPEGTRLPPIRQLAGDLGLATNTVGPGLPRARARGPGRDAGPPRHRRPVRAPPSPLPEREEVVAQAAEAFALEAQHHGAGARRRAGRGPTGVPTAPRRRRLHPEQHPEQRGGDMIGMICWECW